MLKPFLLSVKTFEDERGIFFESYKKSYFKEQTNLDINFVQENHSVSRKNVIRGMHYQWDKPMHKLVRVSYGKILDAIVDIRKQSKDFGKVYYYELSSINNKQLFVPAGFAHGFVCLSDVAHVQYKCSEEYNKNGESGINPLDLHLNIDWKIDIKDAIISSKDKQAFTFDSYKLDTKF